MTDLADDPSLLAPAPRDIHGPWQYLGERGPVCGITLVDADCRVLAEIRHNEQLWTPILRDHLLAQFRAMVAMRNALEAQLKSGLVAASCFKSPWRAIDRDGVTVVSSESNTPHAAILRATAKIAAG